MSKWTYNYHTSTHIFPVDADHEMHVYETGQGGGKEWYMVCFSKIFNYGGNYESFPTLLAAKSMAEKAVVNGEWEELSPSCGGQDHYDSN